MNDVLIVFRKELREILRDRRTLTAIGLAALATPVVLFVISQITVKTATQTYTVGYSGQIPSGLDLLLESTGLKLLRVDDPENAAKREVSRPPRKIGISACPSVIVARVREVPGRFSATIGRREFGGE